MPGAMASRFSPLPVCRCMLPQRSTRWMPLASSSSRLVTGDVQSAVTNRCVGKRRSFAAVRRRRRCHAVRTAAVGLLVEREPDLVLLIQLIGEPRLEDLLVLMQDRLPGRTHVAPLGRLVGVLVEEHAGDEVVGEDVLPGEEEPQLVALERTADAGVELAVALDLARRRQPALLHVGAGVVVRGEAVLRVAAGDRAGRTGCRRRAG